jgi:tetratricopeptide (TPR) repeat protein
LTSPAGELNLAETLNWWGVVYLYDGGNQEKAKAMFERGLAIYQEWGDARGIALITSDLGIAARELDHIDVARTLLEQSLSMFRQFGDLFFVARVSINLGYLFIKQGKYDQAQHLFEQHLEIDSRLQFWDGITDSWYNLAYLHRLQGEYEQASQFCEKSVFIQCPFDNQWLCHLQSTPTLSSS